MKLRIILYLFGLWLFLTPIWIIFCFYLAAGELSVGHASFSPKSTPEMAFIPPAVVFFGLIIWIALALLNQLSRGSNPTQRARLEIGGQVADER
jgi:hypothetical protein